MGIVFDHFLLEMLRGILTFCVHHFVDVPYSRLGVCSSIQRRILVRNLLVQPVSYISLSPSRFKFTGYTAQLKHVFL